MIRVYKSSDSPKSLLEKKSWREDDVNRQLEADQNGKCYLCERSLDVEFQVEHHKCRSKNPNLQYEWSNLLWGCGYCNGRKSDSYDDIINPTQYDVEDMIYQHIDFPNSYVLFRNMTPTNDPSVNSTIDLLNKIYNGKGTLRDFREQRLYDKTKRSINSFQGLITLWLKEHQETVKDSIIKELDKSSEFLGFKYWIIKSNDDLIKEFGDYIIWNKTA